MDKQNLDWIKEPNFYFKRKREVIESLIIGKAINIGCGTHIIKGAKNVDLPEFDATNPKHWHKIDNKYDTIIMSDVIEHLNEDDFAFFNSIVISKKRVIITVPAYQWLFSNYDKLLGHYRRYDKYYFNEEFINMALGSFFYKVNIEIKYLFGALLPLFFIRKYTSGKTPKLPKWADTILYWLSKIVLPFGSTLLIVIDKVKE